jgi:hypothetical protein
MFMLEIPVPKYSELKYLHISLYIYKKRLGTFPFKVQLIQGCKNETTKNTKSVMHHVIRYQVLLAAYYKADTKLLSCNMSVRSHCRLHYTHINCLYTIPSIVGGILQSALNLIQCVKVLRGVKWLNRVKEL